MWMVPKNSGEEGMERGRNGGRGYLRDLPEGGEGLPQRLRLNFRTEVADEDVVVLCKRQEGKGSHSSARLFLYFGLGWVKFDYTGLCKRNVPCLTLLGPKLLLVMGCVKLDEKIALTCLLRVKKTTNEIT